MDEYMDSMEEPFDSEKKNEEDEPLWWCLIGVGFLIAGLIFSFGLALITLSGGIALFRWAIS